jgi:Tannase and feruloyl esterase
MMNHRTFTLTAVLLIVVGVHAVPGLAATLCEDLTKLSLSEATVTSAQMVAAGAFTPPSGGGTGRGGAEAQQQQYAKLPAFCRVMLTLRPSSDSDIKVEVWLPSSGWNGKFEAVVAGAMAGSIPYALMAPALAEGYATSGTDTGHVGNNADFMPEHPEKLIDFAHRAIHEMAVKGKTVVNAYYGSAPKWSYFNACSGGGRAGLASAQRYPDDFQGIVSGAASWNPMRMDAARVAVNLTVNRTPDSAIPPSKYRMIHNAVLQACDPLDGVKDGVIENPTKCKFDYASLACKSDDGPSCLTAAQVESAQVLTSPLKHPNTGAVLFEGHLWPGAELEWDTLGGSQPLSNALIRLRNITFKDPKWDPRQFNTATDVELVEKLDNGLLASNNFDLKPFFDRGGKLLMYHGWADPQVTPQNSIIFYNNVLKVVGKSAENSIALFMLPGVSHCGGGPGPDTFDKMAAISQWVERGQKPARIVASHLTGGKVDRTRPLCPFGQVAKYKGTGDTNEAANFSCAPESMDTTGR